MFVTELRASDTITNYQRLILTRWIAGLSLILSTLFSTEILGLSLRVAPLLLLGVGVILYNWLLKNLAPSSAEVENSSSAHLGQNRLMLQIMLDWLSLSIFLHFTGGITSPGLIFYFLHIIIVAILFPPRQTYLYASLVVLTVAGITLAEMLAILSHQQVIPDLPSALHEQERYVFVELAIFSIAILTTTLLVESIMQPLRQREQQLSALFETSHSVLSTLDVELVLKALAQHACDSLQARGSTIRLLDRTGKQLDLVAEYGEGYLTAKRIPIRPGGPHDIAVKGTEIDVSPATMPDYPQELIEKQTDHVFLVPIRNGRALGLLSIYFKDHVRATQQMRRFARAIADQGANAIENALAHEALQKAEKQRTQFVHVLTHELRSPVVASQSLLRALLSSKTATFSEQQRDILTRLSKRMDDLLSLINDLLSMAASKARDLQEPLQRIELSPILGQIIDQYRYSAKEKQQTLNFAATEKPVYVLATETGIQRIVDNLVGNAIKYTPEAGKVCLELTEDATIYVKDTGIGIPEDSLSELGTEFFRASNAKASNITGTGLGLATVKQLVDHFGGVIDVESTIGEGTTFRIKLPLAEEHHN